MAQITVTEAELGQEIVASMGLLDAIDLVTVPNAEGYKELFTLTDGERVLFNIDPSTSHVSVDSNLLSGGGIFFSTLTLKNIPHGSSFLLDYMPPPTLTSLSPDTAASGDPDFVLSCIGTGFTERAIMMFGQEDEPTTVVSDTEVTTIVKPSIFVPDTIPVCIRIGWFKTDAINFTMTAPAVAEE